MTFDIIELSEAETKALSTIQLKLLRTAQQKKNELARQLEKDKRTYRYIVYADGVHLSTLYEDKVAQLTAEYEEEVGILREQLVFNMSLSEPTTDGETGDGGNDDTGYLVDYELSYLERYTQVRDYYLSIPDPDERIALLAADEVAQDYLDSYYNTLFNYLVSLANGSTG